MPTIPISSHPSADLEFRAPVKRDEQPGDGACRRRSSVLSLSGLMGTSAASGASALLLVDGHAMTSTMPIENDQQDYVRTVGRWGSEWPS